MSRAHAPVAGRRACRWSSPIAGLLRMTRPRSAVTVWPSAPALARLTGFSRSGGSSSLGWLASCGEALVRGLAPSLSLTAECGRPVDSRCTILSALVVSSGAHRPLDASHGVQRPLHVIEGSPASAFRALAGRLLGLVPGGVACASASRPSDVAWDVTIPHPDQMTERAMSPKRPK